MEKPKEFIQLSDHVKNKIQTPESTHSSFMSDEVFLSVNSDDEIEPVAPPSISKALVRHESTFVVREMPLPFIKSESCEHCYDKDQRLTRFEEENAKLSAKIRLLTIENARYEEENRKLKENSNEYRQNKKILLNQTKENEQIQRLRHELQVYNQILAAKRREEQKQNEYFYYFRRE